MEVSTAFGPVSGTLRLARAIILGCVMMLLGVLGHVSAHGLLPGAGTLSALWAANVVVATALLGRPVPIRYVVLLVAGGQTAVHLTLTLTAGHLGDATAGDVAPASVVSGLDGGLAVTIGWPQLLAELSAHAPMMVAHLLAGCGVGMWLGVGERALWGLIAAAHTRILRPVIALLAALAAVRVLAVGVLVPMPDQPKLPRPRYAVLARSVVRRGPPVLPAA
ncbi:MAG: hypothetical protein ACRCYU_20330 [Nocardioides sp.]